MYLAFPATFYTENWGTPKKQETGCFGLMIQVDFVCVKTVYVLLNTGRQKDSFFSQGFFIYKEYGCDSR